MKKNLYLAIAILSSNFILAQNISISGSSIAEVGKPNTYSLTFTPSTAVTGATGYIIDNWLILANIGSGGTIIGNINGEQIPNYYYTTSPVNQVNQISNTKTITLPIQWGENAPTSDYIEIQVAGRYIDSNGAQVGNSINTSYISSHPGGFFVDVKTISAPTISNPVILVCCTNNVQISATQYGDADVFTWIVSGGNIVSGNGSSTITVAPDGNENPFVTACTVKRSTGLASYTRSSSKTISKTARTVSFYPVYGTSQPLVDYICKGSGTLMKVDTQCGLISVNWVAPNCTISGQGSLNATIVPNISLSNGSMIDVYAVAQYQGGCTATTSIKPFYVFDGFTPPLPSGYVKFVSVSGNPCVDEGFNIEFIPDVPYANGRISVTPAVIPPGRGNRAYSFNVCNYNYCLNTNTCKLFQATVPAPCITQSVLKISTLNVLISPNPTTDKFAIDFNQDVNGNYTIFDLNGIEVQSAKIANTKSVQVDLNNKLISGTYYIQIQTETELITKQIILNR